MTTLESLLPWFQVNYAEVILSKDALKEQVEQVLQKLKNKKQSEEAEEEAVEVEEESMFMSDYEPESDGKKLGEKASVVTYTDYEPESEGKSYLHQCRNVLLTS